MRSSKAIPKKSSSLSWKGVTSYLSDFPVGILIVLQLLGVSILPMPKNSLVQYLGFAIVLLAMWISFQSRRDLGHNWVHAGEYQIKPRQSLTTQGIYAYIRHPIYLSFTLSYIGGELVAQSWLFLSFFAFFLTSYYQAKQEEKNFLKSQFGAEYKQYMTHTKMLIPFVL